MIRRMLLLACAYGTLDEIEREFMLSFVDRPRSQNADSALARRREFGFAILSAKPGSFS